MTITQLDEVISLKVDKVHVKTKAAPMPRPANGSQFATRQGQTRLADGVM